MTSRPHRPEAPSTRAPGPERDAFAGLLLLLALGLGSLRFLRLGTWSLWLDEALTLADSLHRSSLKNPLGYWLFGAFYRLLPARPDELWLRLPAALCGFLSIPLAAGVFRPWIGRRAAAAAALFLAASSWHLYWSQMARFYTLVLLLGLCGAGLVLGGLERGSPARVLLGHLLTAAGALVHPSAALLYGALIVASWLACAPRVPWAASGLARSLRSGTRAGRLAWRAHVGCGVLALLLGTGWSASVWRTWSIRTGAGSVVHFVLSWGYLVTPLLALGILLGTWCALRARDGRAVLVVLVALCGTLAAAAAALFVRVSAQYVFVLLPWYAAAAALPVEAWSRAAGGRLRAGVYAALLSAPLLVETGLYFGWRNGDRPMWREAFRFVFENGRDDDLVLAMEAPVGEYYLEPRKTDLRSWRRVTWLDGYRAHLAADWARHPRRTWFVVNLEQFSDASTWSAADRRAMLATLAGECRLVRSFEIPLTPRDLDVLVYLRE